MRQRKSNEQNNSVREEQLCQRETTEAMTSQERLKHFGSLPHMLQDVWETIIATENTEAERQANELAGTSGFMPEIGLEDSG